MEVVDPLHRSQNSLQGDSVIRPSSSVSEIYNSGVDRRLLRKHAKRLEEKYADGWMQFPSIFSYAQDEIFKLMEGDSFRRYVRSHLYRDLVEKQRAKEKQREVLEIFNGGVTS